MSSKVLDEAYFEKWVFIGLDEGGLVLAVMVRQERQLLFRKPKKITRLEERGIEE
jgi:uncharacterized protein YuzE